MAGQGVSATVQVEYAGAEVAARTAALVSALGATDTNADVGGTWTTTWAAINFSTNKKTDSLFHLFAEVIGALPTGVTITIVAAL